MVDDKVVSTVPVSLVVVTDKAILESAIEPLGGYFLGGRMGLWWSVKTRFNGCETLVGMIRVNRITQFLEYSNSNDNCGQWFKNKMQGQFDFSV